jgi:hypothetical protein
MPDWLIYVAAGVAFVGLDLVLAWVVSSNTYDARERREARRP